MSSAWTYIWHSTSNLCTPRYIGIRNWGTHLHFLKRGHGDKAWQGFNEVFGLGSGEVVRVGLLWLQIKTNTHFTGVNRCMFVFGLSHKLESQHPWEGLPCFFVLSEPLRAGFKYRTEQTRSCGPKFKINFSIWYITHDGLRLQANIGSENPRILGIELGLCSTFGSGSERPVFEYHRGSFMLWYAHPKTHTYLSIHAHKIHRLDESGPNCC